MPTIRARSGGAAGGAAFYVDTAGANSAKLADPGYYVPVAWSSFETSAPAGSYVDTTGAGSARLADPGHFVPGTGSTFQLAAPVRYFVLTSGASEAVPRCLAISSPPAAARPTSGGWLETRRGASLTSPSVSLCNTSHYLDRLVVGPVGAERFWHREPSPAQGSDSCE